MKIHDPSYFILPMAFIVYALYLCWLIIKQERKSIASPSWPSVTVTIISKEVFERRGKGAIYFTPQIKYEYSAQRERITRTISLNPSVVEYWFWLSSDSDQSIQARKTAEHHLDAMAKKMEIRYNPQKPRDHICNVEPVKNYVLRLVLSLLIAFVTISPYFLFP